MTEEEQILFTQLPPISDTEQDYIDRLAGLLLEQYYLDKQDE